MVFSAFLDRKGYILTVHVAIVGSFQVFYICIYAHMHFVDEVFAQHRCRDRAIQSVLIFGLVYRWLNRLFT